jgi:two-component system nitrate/nitrite response regulator NarL
LEDSGLVVTGVASDLDTFLATIHYVTPAVLLASFDGDLAECTRSILEIRACAPKVRVVLLSDRAEFLAQAFDPDIDGYLLKTITVEALVQSIRLISFGEKVYSSSMMYLLAKRILHMAPTPAVLAANLSPRESHILGALASGESNKLIAWRLGIAEPTVKVHVKNLCRKLKVRNRTHAAIWAVNNGVEPLPPVGDSHVLKDKLCEKRGGLDDVRDRARRSTR